MPDDYDIEQETESSVRMLEESIPARLHEAYRLLGENAQYFESWRADLFVKLLRNVEGNCRELRETIPDKGINLERLGKYLNLFNQ